LYGLLTLVPFVLRTGVALRELQHEPVSVWKYLRHRVPVGHLPGGQFNLPRLHRPLCQLHGLVLHVHQLQRLGSRLRRHVRLVLPWLNVCRWILVFGVLARVRDVCWIRHILHQLHQWDGSQQRHLLRDMPQRHLGCIADHVLLLLVFLQHLRGIGIVLHGLHWRPAALPRLLRRCLPGRVVPVQPVELLHLFVQLRLLLHLSDQLHRLC